VTDITDTPRFGINFGITCGTIGDVTVDKARENRARRAAARRGWRLQKTRAVDPLKVGYGRFAIRDADGTVISGAVNSDRGLTIEQIEQFLQQERGARRQR
jgi:hypothetical protein